MADRYDPTADLDTIERETEFMADSLRSCKGGSGWADDLLAALARVRANLDDTERQISEARAGLRNVLACSMIAPAWRVAEEALAASRGASGG